MGLIVNYFLTCHTWKLRNSVVSIVHDCKCYKRVNYVLKKAQFFTTSLGKLKIKIACTTISENQLALITTDFG